MPSTHEMKNQSNINQRLRIDEKRPVINLE